MAQFDNPYIAPVAISLALIYAISRLSKIGSRERHLPPGPPTLPLIGNLSILPLKDAYIKYAEWAKIYGDVYSLKIGPETLIVISSLEAMDEILEKNGAITADRGKFAPVLRFAPSGQIAFTPYGPQWRKMRKAAVEVLKSSTRKRNLPIQMAEISQMLFDMNEDPQNMFDHIHRSAMSQVFSIVGGVRIPRADSTLRATWADTWETINRVCEPGYAPPVDLIPILDYIPDKYARNWKAQCAAIRTSIRGIICGMINDVEQRLKTDQTVGCHLELMLQNAQEWELDLESIIGIAGGLFTAGTSTSATLLHLIVFFAAAFPEYQRKIHEELDQVVGAERSPILEDTQHLPFLNAFISEIHRFRPIVPLLTPHLAQEDQWYQGYLIPKGSQIMSNQWAAFHNPDLFENPETFDPERFIRSPYGTKPGVEDRVNVEALKRIETIPFGFGRRRCVGMQMAVDSAALAAVNLFWAYEFGSLINDDGDPIEPDFNALNKGITNDPLPFKCKLKIRSSRHAEIIKQNYIHATPVFEQFERELSKEDRDYVERVRAGL